MLVREKREGERDRETERQRQRQSERQRERERERKRSRERERERTRDGDRETEAWREREKEQERPWWPVEVVAALERRWPSKSRGSTSAGDEPLESEGKSSESWVASSQDSSRVPATSLSPARSLRGSSNLLRRAETNISSWHEAAALISDVDCWQLIDGRGVVRYTRLVRPIVSLRGSILSGRASCSGSQSFAMLCVLGGVSEVVEIPNDVGTAKVGGLVYGNPNDGGVISEPPFFSNVHKKRNRKRTVCLFAVWSFYSLP